MSNLPAAVFSIIMMEWFGGQKYSCGEPARFRLMCDTPTSAIKVVRVN